MLRSLTIENYGLIPNAEISFADGATIFTGETGSGKTMLLGALGLAFGERASVDAVRRGATRAAVTLVLEPDAALRARLNEDGYPLDEGEDAVIVRDVTDAGKSSVRINGRSATAGYLREVMGNVADMVGQHDAQRLLLAAYHGDLLDRFGAPATTNASERVAVAYATLQGLRDRLEALGGDDRRALARCEEARYALDEIDAAGIETGEDDRLTERRRYLDNVERVTGALQTADTALAGDDAGASGTLGIASVALHGIAEISGALAEMAEQAAALQSEANDLATRIARELEGTEFDPNELETINARLDALDKLKRRYGGTLESVVAHAAACRTTIDDFASRDERLAELRSQCATAEDTLETVAADLTAARAGAGKALAKRVSAEFADVALASATFEVAFERLAEIGAEGAERTEFAFAANAGEPLRPLARVASGGELSRVLLALVVALADKDDRSALIFDEIDAGIGGATATAVGAHLGRLAKATQVVCVTHLAQLATWADRHYLLEKSEAKNATTITVREIVKRDDREAELARMLSGETHDVALKHARTLLASAKG